MGLCVFSLPISLVMIERIHTLSYYHHQVESVKYYPFVRVRSWNNGMRCMSLYILMNSWYGQIASRDIRVLVVVAPNPAFCHRHDDWHLAYIFSLVYFSVDVCLVGVLLAQGEIPVSGSVHPSRWLPPSREIKNRTGGDPALHLSQVRGHLNWHMDLPALLGGNLGCWLFKFPLNSPLYCAVYGVCHRQDTSRPYGRILYNLLPTIIIIIQECSQALEIYKCLLSLSCGGVPNMLLVLSITFHFHQYIWGCMCSTWPFQLRWLLSSNRKYQPYPLSHFSVVVCLRFFLDHIMSLSAYTFRENRDFVFIIIVQIMMSANIWIRFGVQMVFVCLYITPSHYHHCANLSEDIELMKCLSDIFCRVCE